MPKIVETVTQSGNDTFTQVTVLTGLTVDGKSGWQVNAIEAYWSDGNTVAAGDTLLSATVQTTEGLVTSFGSDDEIARVAWGGQNTGGVAVFAAFEPIKSAVLFEPRVTVQPALYLGVSSANTGQANDVVVVVYYEIVKLSDIEVLRLLAGGA